MSRRAVPSPVRLLKSQYRVPLEEAGRLKVTKSRVPPTAFRQADWKSFRLNRAAPPVGAAYLMTLPAADRASLTVPE